MFENLCSSQSSSVGLLMNFHVDIYLSAPAMVASEGATRVEVGLVDADDRAMADQFGGIGLAGLHGLLHQAAQREDQLCKGLLRDAALAPDRRAPCLHDE